MSAIGALPRTPEPYRSTASRSSTTSARNSHHHHPSSSSSASSSSRPRRSRPRTSSSSRPRADVIDALDPIGGIYHHGGPFDATLAAVNQHPQTSPLEAVKDSNQAALAATPSYHIRDALRKHVPLQGTAEVPPGELDLEGCRMDYEEGADLMREPDAEGGAYKRWAGRDYHPDDLKGKGAAYLVEKAEKDAAMRDSPRRLRKRSASHHAGTGGGGGMDGGYEMTSRSSRRSLGGESDRLLPEHNATTKTAHSTSRSIDRGALFGGPGSSSSSAGKRDRSGSGSSFTEGLKRRLGSLRRK